MITMMPQDNRYDKRSNKAALAKWFGILRKRDYLNYTWPTQITGALKTFWLLALKMAVATQK